MKRFMTEPDLFKKFLLSQTLENGSVLGQKKDVLKLLKKIIFTQFFL